MKQLIRYILSLLFLLTANNSFGSPYSALIDSLERVVNEREYYFDKQLAAIEQQENSLLHTNDMRERFDIYYKAFDLSRSFKYDMAYKYATEALNIAQELGDKNLICRAVASKLSTLTSGGLFAEAAALIDEVDVSMVDSTLRRELYYNIIRHYSDRRDYAEETEYHQLYSEQIRAYADSILTLSDQKDYYYAYAKYYYEMSYNRVEQAVEALQHFYGSTDISEHHNSIIAFLLANGYFELGNEEAGFAYMFAAVKHDIQAAARENRSIKSTSQLLFARGEEKIAELLINIAYKDATFYNARHRNLEINTLLPIINRETIETIRQQRQLLYLSLIGVSILGVIALLFWMIARRRAEELRTSKSIIERGLRDLIEANSIKEHYIIESLQKKSEHMEMIAALLKKIDTKVKSRQYDDLRSIYKDFNMKRERENFFSDFDRAFLNLFPTFIEEYNQLFNPKDRVVKSGDEFEMPAEMRIFALIRLGITDNEQIARFLNLSINTVYTYKTKVKNKTSIPKEELEKRVCQLGKIKYMD